MNSILLNCRFCGKNAPNDVLTISGTWKHYFAFIHKTVMICARLLEINFLEQHGDRRISHIFTFLSSLCEWQNKNSNNNNWRTICAGYLAIALPLISLIC